MSDIFKEIDVLQEKIKAHRSLSPDQRKFIKEYYRIGLTYSSNAVKESQQDFLRIFGD